MAGPTRGILSDWRKVPQAKASHETFVGGEYTDDEIEFLRAVVRFKSHYKVRFPTATDYLRIARDIGYRKAG